METSKSAARTSSPRGSLSDVGDRRLDVGGSDGEAPQLSIQVAIDHGVNLIDTAPVYGFGVAEEIVGRALAAMAAASAS